MTPRDEPERDPWLGQALRHAPDADAEPPTALSDHILRQARAAVTPRAAPAQPGALLRGWSWLARPPVAAGFASVMVATVVGLMWWGRPLDEALPRAQAPAAVAERPAAAPAQAPAAVRDEEPAVERAKPEAPRAAAKRSAPPISAAPAPRTPAPAPAPPTAPAPTSAPADEAAAPAAAAESRARAPDIADASQAAARALNKAAPAAGLASHLQAADSAAPLGEPARRWRWQRGGDPQPMTPALQRWLAELARVARWRPAAAAPPAPADAGSVLVLSRDGAPHSTIQLDADAVWLTPVAGLPLVATLSPAAAAALRAALLDATP